MTTTPQPDPAAQPDPAGQSASESPAEPERPQLSDEQVDRLADHLADRIDAPGPEPRYAAYDKTYGVYLPGTYDTAAKAKAAGEKAGVKGRRLDVRDVSVAAKATRTR